MFRSHSIYVIFYINGILWASFASSINLFYKSYWKVSDFIQNSDSITSYIFLRWVVYTLFLFSNVLIFSLSMFIVYWYSCVFYSSFRKNFILLLAFASEVEASWTFSSSATSKLSVYEVFYWSSQFSFHILNHLFPFIENNDI